MNGYTSGDSRRILESFNDKYLLWYDSRRRIQRVHRKLRAQKTADLLDTIDMIDLLMEKHQMTFYTNNTYPWQILFPYMFIKPKSGEKILNTTTGELYEILHVMELQPNFRRWNNLPFIKEPKRSSFTGVIILKQGHVAPAAIDILEFVNKDKNLINFFEWGSKRNASHPLPEGLDNHESQNGAFKPTITWTIKKTEPGSIGKRPFDDAKELKPRLRETFLDPDRTYLIPSEDQQAARQLQTVWPTGSQITTGSYQSLSEIRQNPSLSTHTITVWGQWFDNLVQFDCWSTNNQEVNTLIYWFEDFMDLYTRVLKINGVQEVLYWQRLQDQTIDRWRADIDNRTIQYFFRTEKLRVERSKNLKSYTLKVRIASNNEESLLISEPTGITTYSGVYGGTNQNNSYNTYTGYAFTGTSYYTGNFEYNWGDLEIEQ